MRCVLKCFDEYIKFINKNAFIQCALKSENFCGSAKAAFWLIMRNAGRFSAASVVGWIMMMLGKGAIMGLSCYLTFLIIKEAAPEVDQPVVPTMVILLVSYMVASMFLSIFSFSSTAILHCFLLDEDTGGSKFTPDGLQGFIKDCTEKAEKEEKFKKLPEGSNTGNQGDKANDME